MFPPCGVADHLSLQCCRHRCMVHVSFGRMPAAVRVWSKPAALHASLAACPFFSCCPHCRPPLGSTCHASREEYGAAQLSSSSHLLHLPLPLTCRRVSPAGCPIAGSLSSSPLQACPTCCSQAKFLPSPPPPHPHPHSTHPAGVSHLLEYMAFKTTKNRTHLRLVREVEAIGGNVLASGELGGTGGWRVHVAGPWAALACM